MSKRKILALALTLSMIAILAVGGTLAYFMDTTEVKTNVFTIGNVGITLNEVFDANEAKLIPGKDITKEVTVTNNESSEPAYVRVHIAFPAMLDSGSEDEPQYASYNNTLHWNFSKAAVADGQWNWHKTNEDGASLAGWPGNGGDWNCYTTKIDGIDYNVYVATYETVLDAEAETSTPAIYKVYLDANVTNEQVTGITDALGNNVNVYVVAEGAQAEGFTNAYDALDSAFGVPGTYSIDWVKVAEDAE